MHAKHAYSAGPLQKSFLCPCSSILWQPAWQTRKHVSCNFIGRHSCCTRTCIEVLQLQLAYSPVWFWVSCSTVSLVWDCTTTLVVVSNAPRWKPSVVGALPGLFWPEVLIDIASSSSLLTWSSRMDALLDWSWESSLFFVFGRGCEPLGFVGVVGMGATLLDRFRGDIGLFGVVCCWAGFLLLKSVSLRRSYYVCIVVQEREREREKFMNWMTIRRRD